MTNEEFKDWLKEVKENPENKSKLVFDEEFEKRFEEKLGEEVGERYREFLDVYEYGQKSKFGRFLTDLSAEAQKLKESTQTELKKFSEQPLQYTSKTSLNLVKDYWDVGAAILAGYALNDYGNKIFGEYRFLTVGAGILASMAGAYNNDDRLFRNGYAGLASFAYFSPRGTNVSEFTKIGSKIFGLGFGGIATYLDYYMRKTIEKKD